MMARRCVQARTVVAGMAALWAAGCGSSGPEPDPEPPPVGPLDCAWLASDNCWDQAVAEVAVCIPQDDLGSVPAGVLAADRLSCSYPSDVVVTFDDPVGGSLPAPFGVTASDGGERCYRFEHDEAEVFFTRLETASGAITLEGERSEGIFGASVPMISSPRCPRVIPMPATGPDR
jgi:hypothetical protein